MTLFSKLVKMFKVFDPQYYTSDSYFKHHMCQDIQNPKFYGTIDKFYHKFDPIEYDNINKQFADADGYFTKLVSNNRLVGYVFRCTHKNVPIKTKDGSTIIIPYFVTCHFQNMIEGLSPKQIKTIGKSIVLKSGLRYITKYQKHYPKKDLTFDTFKNLSYNTIDCVFPNYTSTAVIQHQLPFFYGENKAEYDKIVDYVKNFDNKIYTYYNNVDKENIVKFWTKSENMF